MIPGSPRSPVRYEGIDGCVGYRILVHGLTRVTNKETSRSILGFDFERELRALRLGACDNLVKTVLVICDCALS